MNTDQILKVLRNERECIKRQVVPKSADKFPYWKCVSTNYERGIKCWVCRYCGNTLYEPMNVDMKFKKCSCSKDSESAKGKCDRNCGDCDLCLPDTEILEVYDFLIEAYEALEKQDDYAMTCTNCGGKVDKNNICPSCGYRLYDVTSGNDIMRQFKSMPLPEGFVAAQQFIEGGNHE